jgi:hypothetical protein
MNLAWKTTPVTLDAWKAACAKAYGKSDIVFFDREKYGRTTVTCWASTCPDDRLFGVYFVNGDSVSKIPPGTGWTL